MQARSLHVKTVLFQAIQFSKSTKFNSILPIDRRLHQVLPLRARADSESMAMKGCCAFPKAQALLEPHHQIV